MSQADYAGDIGPAEAFRILSEDPRAVLVDVRTDAEWSYVGLPDLSAIGKAPLRIAWKLFPEMRVNPDFAAAIEAQGIAPEQPLLFLCRSGVRSRDAAIAMTAAGYRRCYNVADGFEGPHDGERHRGRVGGWKAAGLPWLQE